MITVHSPLQFVHYFHAQPGIALLRNCIHFNFRNSIRNPNSENFVRIFKTNFELVPMSTSRVTMLLLQAVQAHRKGGPLYRAQRKEGRKARPPHPARMVSAVPPFWPLRTRKSHSLQKADGEGRVLVVSFTSMRKDNWLFAKP